MKHASEEELLAYREGNVKNRQATAAHLEGCAECRAELERIEALFRALDALPVPDPGEDYGTRVWRQIAPRLPERPVRWWQSLFAARRLATVGVLAAVVIAAFYLGRHTGTVPEVSELVKVRERVLVVAVGQHLGRSEMILVELANAQPAQGSKLVNIAAEQKRAESLVEENRLYRQSALNGGDNAMASTLGELERVLLDVANSPAEVTPAQFEAIRKRIAERGILLKVRVVRQELQSAESGRKSEPAQNDSKGKERNKA